MCPLYDSKITASLEQDFVYGKKRLSYDEIFRFRKGFAGDFDDARSPFEIAD